MALHEEDIIYKEILSILIEKVNFEEDLLQDRTTCLNYDLPSSLNLN